MAHYFSLKFLEINQKFRFFLINTTLSKPNFVKAILTSETKLLLSRIQSRDKAPEERDKISTSNGLWSYILDKNQIAYIGKNIKGFFKLY